MKNKKIIICIILLVVIILGIILLFLPKNNLKWAQEGNVISRGDEKYNIGDYYEYDETNNGEINGIIDVKWKVFGVDENGDLLIMSASNVGEITLGNKENLEVSQEDYVKGIDEINGLTLAYGKGKGAKSVRSIKASDLMVVGKYDISELTNYNNEITYYWTDAENPKYVNTSGEEGISKLPYNSYFIWYDEDTKTWQNIVKPDDATSENPLKIATAINNLTAFDNTRHSDLTLRLSEDSAEFKMIYLDDEGNRANYWVADTYTTAVNNYIAYGYLVVKYDTMNYNHLVYSQGTTRELTTGVRAIVTID